MAEEASKDSKGKGKAPAEEDKMDPADVAKMLRALGLTADNLPGAIVGGKKQKDMSSYKFWQTQPVPSFGNSDSIRFACFIDFCLDDAKQTVEAEGPIKEVDIEKVPKNPPGIPDLYEWCTMDLTNDEQVDEVYDLLSNHYVEDDEAMFRFNYSKTFFNW
jgi:glycylpeptide N-tetradecanoyltransferase